MRLQGRYARPFRSDELAQQHLNHLHELLLEEVEAFSTEALHWPFVLVILTESTIQNLRFILKSIFGESTADRKIREWTGLGLHTITLDMQRDYEQACSDPTLRAQFLARYGHRGPGEMDLMNPRWFELGEAAFRASSIQNAQRKYIDHAAEVEAEIQGFTTFKRESILDEWRWLKRLLETRELWKMEILKPYAQIRLTAEELGRRHGLGEDIHWLECDEICNLHDLVGARALIQERRAEARAFRAYSFPEILALNELEGFLQPRTSTGNGPLEGEPLSSGVAFGEVRFVADPAQVDAASWPENTILVSETTDPGWTSLFLKARGIIVERGGVLSHCSILARELGLPAVGGILNIKTKLKDGDRIWVDGNSGRIKFEQS